MKAVWEPGRRSMRFEDDCDWLGSHFKNQEDPLVSLQGTTHHFSSAAQMTSQFAIISSDHYFRPGAASVFSDVFILSPKVPKGDGGDVLLDEGGGEVTSFIFGSNLPIFGCTPN